MFLSFSVLALLLNGIYREVPSFCSISSSGTQPFLTVFLQIDLLASVYGEEALERGTCESII